METKKQNNKQALLQFKITLPVVSLSDEQMSQFSGGTVRLT